MVDEDIERGLLEPGVACAEARWLDVRLGVTRLPDEREREE